MDTTLSEPVVVWSTVTRRNLPVLGCAALLLAEVLVLSYRFDSQALVDGGRWWGPLVGYARYLPQGLMAAAVAALVFGGRGLRAGLAGGGDGGGSRGARPLAFLAGHLAAFAALAWLTGAVWEGPLGRSPYAGAWVVLWLLTGAGALALGLAAARPAAAWWGLVRRSSGVLLAALAVAAVACAAGRATTALARPLNVATYGLVRSTLALAFADVVAEPGAGVVGTGGFVVRVEPECSGYEGIGLVWVFLAAYLGFFRRELRFPQALWLLPVGTLVIWVANAARIVALVVIGSRVSAEVALGGFHSQAGWLAFNAVALGLVVVSRRWRFFAAVPAPRASAPTTHPTAAYLGPLLALVASVMVTAALSGGTGFDRLYPARVLAVLAALWACRRGYAGLRWAWSWQAVGLGAAAFAVWMALEPAPSSADPAAAGMAAGLAALPGPLAALWLAARVAGSVVTVPVAEELAFRGYLTRRLIAADFTAVAPGRFTWASFVVSSCLFGALHGGRWYAGALAGALYALALYRKGELSEAVLAHATTNALIAAYVLATGSWSLWL